MHRMVAESDVFLWNQTMANLEPLGLDYETLSAINPGLVFATNSGYGHRGINKPAFDMTVQALTGHHDRASASPVNRPSTSVSAAVTPSAGSCRHWGSWWPCIGGASPARASTWTRRCSARSCSSLHPPCNASWPPTTPSTPTSIRGCDTLNPLWNRYQAEDRWMFTCMENTDANFAAFCAAIERDDLRADERFADPDRRASRARVELIEVLDTVFAQRTAGEWLERFDAHGVVAAPINSFRDVAGDEQAWANDYFARLFCGEAGGEVEFRGLPITLSRTPGRIESLGPGARPGHRTVPGRHPSGVPGTRSASSRRRVPYRDAEPLDHSAGLRVIEISTMMAGPYARHTARRPRARMSSRWSPAEVTTAAISDPREMESARRS